MNQITRILLLLLLPCCGLAAEQKVTLQYPESDVRDVLVFYAKISNRKVWVELGVVGRITIRSDGPIPANEAVRLIRKNLLDQCGIDLQERGESETFVTWSADPQHQELKRKMQLSGAPPPAPDGRQRIRVINPK